MIFNLYIYILFKPDLLLDAILTEINLRITFLHIQLAPVFKHSLKNCLFNVFCFYQVQGAASSIG